MSEKTNVNQAGIEELAALPDIGQKLAERIVAYRQDVHPFEEVIELTAVPGISERMVRAIEDQVTVGEEATVAATAVAPPTIIEEEPVVDTTAVATLKEALQPEPEPVAEPEPDPVMAAPVPRPTPTPAPAPPRRNRSMVGGIIGAIFGAIIGSVLTLAILHSLNGTLYFTSQDRAAEIQQALDSDLDGVRTDQNSLSEDVDMLTTRLAEVEIGQTEMAVLAEEITAVQATAAAIDDRVNEVADSVAIFDAFLTGLRDLLIDFQGPPPTPTSTATHTATPTITNTPIVTPSPEPSATSTSMPVTRTPRPTATPLVTTTPDQ
jgi:competence ComEA-like helix-hairpin-helix protein